MSPRLRLSRPPALPPRLDPGATLLAARGAGADLSGRPIVQAVDLEVRAGEVVALVGPNGAGKSTLLSLLAGDIDTTRGEVLLHGEPLGRWTSREMAQRRAVLTQKIAVSFPFRVEDHVRMGRAPWLGTELDVDDDDIIETSIARTGTTHLIGRQLPSLSGGELARVALSRVLAQRTQLVLLDEPTAALDIHYQEQVLEVLGSLAADGGGVVIVLHDLTVAANHADRVALLADGGLVAVGPPPDVMTPEQLSAVYQHDIDVIRHPRTGDLLVAPERAARKVMRGRLAHTAAPWQSEC